MQIFCCLSELLLLTMLSLFSCTENKFTSISIKHIFLYPWELPFSLQVVFKCGSWKIWILASSCSIFLTVHWCSEPCVTVRASMIIEGWCRGQKKLMWCGHDTPVRTTKPCEKLTAVSFLLYSTTMVSKMFAGYTVNNTCTCLLCIINDNMLSVVPLLGQWNAFEMNCKNMN